MNPATASGMIINFGMHKGKSLGWVGRNDPLYLEHLKGGGVDADAADMRDEKFRTALDVVRGQVRRSLQTDADDPYDNIGDPYL